MYLAENYKDKWDKVINHPDLEEIKDPYKRDVTTRLLENQETFLQEAAPANSTADVDNWDPILISLVRRAMPHMMAYDVCGVQPMTGPTGLIFALKSHYEVGGTPEALFNEADTDFGGAGTHVATDGTNNPFAGTWTTGTGNATATGEALGDASNNYWPEMSFSIAKTSVTAKTRALKAEYTTELSQDLKAVHGLDAETELSNILSTEILAEINREVIRTIYLAATAGAQNDVTTAGTFDLNTDSNGRWSVEKFKGMMFNIERDAHEIAKSTRRGKGNILITSSDVASALAMAGDLNTVVDETQNTYVGNWGSMKIYVDPYYTSTAGNYYVVGYKGGSPYDAGLFYCPYVPLQMVRAVGEQTFQPKIGFKTRYGIVSNPMTAITSGANTYYRKVKVNNLM